MRARTLGREAALKVLYQLDLRSDLDDGAIDELVEGLEVRPPDAAEFAKSLVRGVRRHQEAIDAELATVARNWTLERMAVIDRNILRIGAYELLHEPDIPAAVTIDEAVNMAKAYSTKDSGAFVNGILDRIHQRRATPAEAGEP
ncbi:MAG: transcription antitermination factor NusB [Planctomycetota bacterium]|nr:MAG: transcription antitermination factor NusB [Planctomycetota bacterium]